MIIDERHKTSHPPAPAEPERERDEAEDEDRAEPLIDVH